MTTDENTVCASRTIVESTVRLFENVEQNVMFHTYSSENQFWRISPRKSHSDVRHIRWERRSCTYYWVMIPRHFINCMKH